MPTPTKYTYSISQDFPGSAVDTDNLASEVQASSIVIAYDRIEVVGDVIDIWFKDVLSAADKIVLDGNEETPEGLIAAHDNVPKQVPDPVTVANIIDVVPHKPTAPKRAYAFSYNWCDKTTWWRGSVRVADKLLGVGDGVTKDFVLEENYPVIELGRGKITNDHNLTVNDEYNVCAYIGVATEVNELAEREPFEESGGDYWVDYDNPGTAGTMIHFETAPVDGEDITVCYSYCPTDTPGHSTWWFGPPAGKKWVIDHIEAQFTADVDLTDTIVYQAWVDHPTYGWIPVPGESELRYHSANNFDDYVRGALCELPAWGGTSKRGRTQTGRVIQWDYDSSIVLLSSQAVAVRVWCKHDRAMGGERVTITIYAMEEDE